MVFINCLQLSEEKNANGREIEYDEDDYYQDLAGVNPPNLKTRRAAGAAAAALCAATARHCAKHRAPLREAHFAEIGFTVLVEK